MKSSKGNCQSGLDQGDPHCEGVLQAHFLPSKFCDRLWSYRCPQPHSLHTHQWRHTTNYNAVVGIHSALGPTACSSCILLLVTVFAVAADVVASSVLQILFALSWQIRHSLESY